MDRISLLPDDLILKILSYAPTNDALSTSFLSKRWRSIWKHVPNILYSSNLSNDHDQASRFVDKFLLLNKAPVLTHMLLFISRHCRPTDIETWISIAVSRRVSALLVFRHASAPIQFPMSLYTCESLVNLSLYLEVIVDDIPLTFCFRSLKSLTLLKAAFSSEDIVHRLLAGCPVLTALTVNRPNNNKVKTLRVMVPSLQRLTVVDLIPSSQVRGGASGFVISAPSLKSLTIGSHFDWCNSLVNMPNLVMANIKLPNGSSEKFMECLTSANQLSLCLHTPMVPYPKDVYYQLDSLNLCTCSLAWCSIILRFTPKLRILRFKLHQVSLFPTVHHSHQICYSSNGDVLSGWELPSSVPECLISSLETVEWIDYKGTEAQKKVVVYLLENSGQLKTVTIRSLASTDDKEKIKMQQDFSSTPRGSNKCRLLFS